MSLKRSKQLLFASALLALLFLLAPQPSQAQVTLNHIVKGTYGSTYSLVWDGWKGNLELRRDGTGSLWVGARRYNVRAVYLSNPQTNVSGRQGPGYLGTGSAVNHRLVFWIDLNNTPSVPSDDQRFDGYFFTQTVDGMAGVTWWANIPFGFYAKYLGDIPG